MNGWCLQLVFSLSVEGTEETLLNADVHISTSVLLSKNCRALEFSRL